MKYRISKAEHGWSLYAESGFLTGYVPRSAINGDDFQDMQITFAIGSVGSVRPTPGPENQLRSDVQVWLTEAQMEAAIAAMQKLLETLRQARKEKP